MIIWTPPTNREINERDPFDVAYVSQQAISEADDRDAQLVMARDAKDRLAMASYALEGMDASIDVNGALICAPNDPDKMIMPTVGIKVRGSIGGFVVLDLSQWNKGVQLGLEVATTVVWPLNRPESPDFLENRDSYPLISGTERIQYGSR